jgi:hypothetical protein
MDRTLPDRDDLIGWKLRRQRNVGQCASLVEGLPDHPAQALLSC